MKTHCVNCGKDGNERTIFCPVCNDFTEFAPFCDYCETKMFASSVKFSNSRGTFCSQHCNELSEAFERGRKLSRNYIIIIIKDLIKKLEKNA